MSHTPGMWMAVETPESSNQQYVINSVAGRIASIDFVGDSETERCNANLIAAAPDLLNALKRMVALGDGVYTRNAALLAADTFARAIIAKATGADK